MIIERRLTVCVTGAGAGVDSAWEQEKLKARKMLENAAESPAFSAHLLYNALHLRIGIRDLLSLQSNA